MELWNYLQILRQKKQGWLFKKDNAEERLLALTKILELGYPSAIQPLIPFLKDENKEIQQATCKTIAHLFKKINTKKGYYDTLKHCDISKSDLDLYSLIFSKEDCIMLYSIATMNSDGYVREYALKQLSDTRSQNAIPFIVYRLADWVKAVRHTALKSLGYFKKVEFINALVEHLTIFEWLQKVERTDLQSVHADIMNFVVIENKSYVTEHFKTFSERTRIVIARHIAKSADIASKDLKILLSDKHFLVRNFALAHFDKLTQAEIDRLLTDKSARIRIQTLYHLKNRANFSEIVFAFIADHSAAIRDFARYSLKGLVADFATIYNDNLLNRRNITGSLSGLAETNGKHFIETIVPFLNDPQAKIRKATFLALKQLDGGKAYHFALQHLDTGYIGMRNVIIDYFSNAATTEVLQQARKIYAEGQCEVKKSMLKLFSKVGKWATIGDIMIGTIDGNESIRQLSLTYLQRWRYKATTYFTKAKPEELERANQLFRYAFEVHEEKKYFNQNPLTGLDFYLQ